MKHWLSYGAVLGAFTAQVAVADSSNSSAVVDSKSLSDIAPVLAESMPDEILVTVNGEAITQSQVDDQLAAMLGPQARFLPEERVANIREKVTQQIVDSLIAKALILQAVKESDVKISDADVDKAVDELKKLLPEDISFSEYLDRINMSEAEVREALALNLQINKLLEMKVGKTTMPTSSDIEKFYNSHKDYFMVPETVEARHILVQVNVDDTDKEKAIKKEKAENIRKNLVAGADFATVAMVESDCPSREQGGDLGSFSKGQMVPAFEEAAFKQSTNEIGKVVETEFGYHIIQVVKHEPERQMPLSEVKGRIEKALQEEDRQKLAQKYVDQLRNQAKIVYLCKIDRQALQNGEASSNQAGSVSIQKVSTQAVVAVAVPPASSNAPAIETKSNTVAVVATNSASK